MTKTSTALVALLVLAGCGHKTSVRFEVGGPASDAANSAHAPWGATVTGLTSATSYVVAAGDGQVTCRILVDDRVVDEQHASGAGNRASCRWR